MNCTNLKLIPKCKGDVSLHNYRPISLIGGVYKIVSKLLTERIKSVMPSIIANFQGAFIHERQINDEILIAAELIDSRIKENKPGIICRVDFEKDFDNINWNCVDIVIQRFGFSNIWRGWIKWCITQARFAVLINGEATPMFKNYKGIRQGDPISPFIFILVAEIVSKLISKSSSDGLLSGF